MNSISIRKKIERKLDQLSPEKLALVSDFIDSIDSASFINLSLAHKLSPIKRGKTTQDLLKFAATWQGDDLEDCLDFVRETRSKTQF